MKRLPDREDRTPEGSRDGLPPEVARYIENHSARSLAPETWETVRPFVVASLLALRPRTVADAQLYTWALTRLAVWGIGEHLPMDPEVLLDPRRVEHYCVVATKELRSRGTLRAVLRRIGPKLTAKAPWEPRPRHLTHRHISVPYTASEFADIREDARTQSTAVRRRGAEALVALGAGVGADGRWAGRVRGTDVEVSSDGVLVRLGPPMPRVVPALADFEADLFRLAVIAGDGFLIGGTSKSGKRVSNLAASLEVGHGHPRINGGRLRSTWLVHHLTIGTRIPELAKAAGLVGTAELGELLEFIPPISDQDSRWMLRGRRP